jgi:Mn2+/Fe2+ NRAMP family transporter
MNAPRQIYVGSLSRREASWGRARRRFWPSWALAALIALAVVGALIGPVILPALAS